MKILDGKAIANDIYNEISTETFEGRAPCLVVVIIGEDPASQVYINRKVKACEKVGFTSTVYALPSSTSESELLSLIVKLNSDEQVDGILVQLPLPKHIDTVKITESVNPEKDVDGFHPINLGKLILGDPTGFTPCTPLGVEELLIRSKIEIKSKHVVILGRSHIVGKPLATLLSSNHPGGNASVTLLHSQSGDIKTLCSSADVIIAAVGRPKMVTEAMIKEGAVVVDVGINRVTNETRPKGFELVGDVDFEKVKDKCSAITPVPGGVGPMTIAMLLLNTLKGYKKRCPGFSSV